MVMKSEEKYFIELNDDEYKSLQKVPGNSLKEKLIIILHHYQNDIFSTEQ
jgi:hypothetical protein